MRNDHKSVLVPLEAWEYNSPYLKYIGKSADIGLFAEAFIYYEQVYVVINTVRGFEEFITFFARGNKIDQLIGLIREKVINIFYYSFMSTAINDRGTFSIWNISAPKEGLHSDFIRLVVNKANLPVTSKQRHLLWKAIVDNLIDETAKNYDAPVSDAKVAMKDNRRCELLVQAYLDNLYKMLGLGQSPTVICKIEDVNPEIWNITTNVDFQKIDKVVESKLSFRPEMPLIGEVTSNRLLWTSLIRGQDLFLGDVMSQVVGNKLHEADRKDGKTKEVIVELENKVEFPDIRKGVNNATITVEEIFNIRIHANKFRQWLQQEGERDRDAILAYHNEVSKASGIQKHVSSTLKMFGNLAQYIMPAAYPVVTKDLSPESNLIVTGTSATAAYFIQTLANSLAQDWKPIIFGDWVKKELSKVQK